MNAQQVASKATEIASDAMVSGVFMDQMVDRFTGVGADQYQYTTVDGEVRQKFEDITFADLMTMIQEEIVDIANYAVMVCIRWPMMTPHYLNVIGQMGDFYQVVDDAKRYALKEGDPHE